MTHGGALRDCPSTLMKRFDAAALTGAAFMLNMYGWVVTAAASDDAIPVLTERICWEGKGPAAIKVKVSQEAIRNVVHVHHTSNLPGSAVLEE